MASIETETGPLWVSWSSRFAIEMFILSVLSTAGSFVFVPLPYTAVVFHPLMVATASAL